MLKNIFYSLLFLMMACAPNAFAAPQNAAIKCDQMQKSNDAAIKDCFIGTWKLVINMKKDGDVVTYPFGKDAVGYITYDANGYMSVQMMQQNRNAPMPGYFAYFGRYEIDKQTHVVHHFLTGSLNPADVETDRQRSYQFTGDQLHLIPVEEPNREVVWEKIN